MFLIKFLIDGGEAQVVFMVGETLQTHSQDFNSIFAELLQANGETMEDLCTLFSAEDAVTSSTEMICLTKCQSERVITAYGFSRELCPLQQGKNSSITGSSKSDSWKNVLSKRKGRN